MNSAATSEMEQHLLGTDRISAFDLCKRSMDEMTPHAFAERIITPSLERIGEGWASGAVSLSQVYMAGRICEELVEYSFANIDTRRLKSGTPRIALTVLGDRHLLGKRLVSFALHSAGIPVVDFGPLEAGPLVERALREDVDILLISSLMLPSALLVKEVVQGLKNRDSRAKVVVGGAPFLFDRELWREVGADAMGRTASEAVAIVRSLSGSHA